MQCFSFEELAPGASLSVFGSNPGPANMWFLNAGDVWGADFELSGGGAPTPGSGQASATQPGYGSSTKGVNVNNILLCFSALGELAQKRITFDYWDFHGNLNIFANRTLGNHRNFMQFNGMPFGKATATVSVDGSNISAYWGKMTLEGIIDRHAFFGHIGIGGQELIIDNVCCEDA